MCFGSLVSRRPLSYPCFRLYYFSSQTLEESFFLDNSIYLQTNIQQLSLCGGSLAPCTLCCVNISRDTDNSGGNKVSRRQTSTLLIPEKIRGARCCCSPHPGPSNPFFPQHVKHKRCLRCFAPVAAAAIRPPFTPARRRRSTFTFSSSSETRCLASGWWW